MKISIIAWDANFRESLHTIKFFMQQDFPSDQYEIIWVDYYNSNQIVKDEIRKLKRVRLLELANHESTPWHLGICINRGISVANGDIIILTDGDIVVEPDHLEYVLNEHKTSRDLVLYHRRLDEKESLSCEKSKSSISYLNKSCHLNNPSNYAGCYSILKSNIKKINGYAEHKSFCGAGMQAKEIYYRFRNAGYSIKWSKTKNIYHPWHKGTGISNKDKERIEILKKLRKYYKWLIPYSGIEQSWISYQSNRNTKKYIANNQNYDDYLLRLPDDLQTYVNQWRYK